MRTYLSYLALMLVYVNGAFASADAEALTRRFDWPGEQNGAAWQLGKEVFVESGSEPEEAKYLRCGFSEPDKATRAVLKGIRVKPETGYIARCRVKAQGGGAQLTFAVLKTLAKDPGKSAYFDENVEKSAGDLSSRGLEFFVSRDEYIGNAFSKWEVIELPFRTEADQHEVGLYAGRRYGNASILYDSVELIEDNSVVIGEISPVSRPLPAIEEKERARGYLVSRQPWMQPAFAGHRPSRDEITDTVSCWLSPDQYEPVTFSITGLRELSHVSVRLASDLEGAGGAKLDAGLVNIEVVRTFTRWLTNSAPLKPGQRYERRPIYLFPNEETRVAEGETKTWWLTVHAPKGQAPGSYRGRILISAEGAPEHALDLTVEVLPINLSAPEVTYGMFYRHFEQVEGFRTEEMFLRAAKDMAAHGMNSISLYTHLERPAAEGGWVTDLDYDSERSYSLNRQLRIFEEAGLLVAGHPLLLLPSHGGNDTIHNYMATLPVLIEKQQKSGWPEFLILLFDEVSHKFHQWEALDREMAKIAAVRKEYPDLTFRTTSTAPGEKSHYFDVIIRGDKMPGKEMWTYNCTWNGAIPVNDRYFAGYYTWSEGLLGNWQWCYSEGRRLELTESGELDFGALSAYVDPLYNNYVLPAEKFNIPTIGWEARRSGVDDYRYLQTLREALEAASKSGDSQKKQLAEKAQAFLDAAGEKLKAPASQTPRSEINSVKAYSHILNPDLPVGEYDQIRREAAEWIMRLSR